MKTKISTITLLAMLYVLPIKAQESYLPVFGGNTVVFFSTAGIPCDGTPCNEIYGTVYTKSTEKQRTYVSLAASFKMLEYSEDNSKLWGYMPSYGQHETDWRLLMDLNLEVGNEYSYPVTNTTCVVTNVYEKDGRKHIEFDKLMYVEWTNESGERQESQIPVMFIEGIGLNCFNGMIFAKFNDKVLDYVIPEIYEPYEARGCYSIYLNIADIKKDSIAITFLSSTNILVHIPIESISSGTQLNIVDTTGKLIKLVNVTGKETTVDISNFPSGIYLLNVSSLPNYTGKFIKK